MGEKRTQNTRRTRTREVIQLQSLQNKLLLHCLNIDELVGANLPQKGDTTDTCQLLNIRRKLLELESAITGIEPSDLVYDPNSDYPDTRRVPCT